MAPYRVQSVKADGIDVFYRSAGDSAKSTVLLLHGFPSSSHQYRHLIPLLAKTNYVVAPDLPGFGFTTVPAEREYKYTFANFATTIGAFLDALKIKKFSVYVFDYGAPTGLRLALERPDAVQAIITQNGNAYVEGFGQDEWAPIQAYWKSGSKEDREALGQAILSFDVVKSQYVAGNPNAGAVEPEAYHLDYALLQRPGIADIQLDIFKDYETNLELYPQFQEYFRSSKVPVLAVWGKNDPIFIYPGAEAFKRDVADLEIHPIDSGHFALESNEEEVAETITAFLQKRNI